MMQLSIDICHPRPSCSKPAARSCCLLAVDRRDRQTHVTNVSVATRLGVNLLQVSSGQFSSVQLCREPFFMGRSRMLRCAGKNVFLCFTSAAQQRAACVNSPSQA